MHVFMALDPETFRVTMQDREFSDGSLPRGLRGLGWSFRETEIPDEVYEAVLEGSLTGREVDEFHRSAWSTAGPDAWPHP